MIPNADKNMGNFGKTIAKEFPMFMCHLNLLTPSSRLSEAFFIISLINKTQRRINPIEIIEVTS